MKKQNYINLLKIILFAPLTFYLGERSPIAFDEGYYILQSKWILLSNDWISPMYWENLVLDRTNGIQFLLALSQKIFGDSNFVIYIPSFLAGLAMIIFTNEIHKELVDKKNQLFSILILSTTFLWINYFHMASQDILFASIITFGIYSSIKAFKTEKNIFLFFSGVWIGLAVMIKTYLAAIPFLAILPFLMKSKVIKNKWFWIGTFSGFIPFIIWSYKIILIYGFKNFSRLYAKLLTLSKNNNFTNPFYYYLWNLILNTLPWSIFSILGFVRNLKIKDKLSHYFLFKYPLIIMIMLSIFSTKTPYYPIQILPIISINAYLGIIYILEVKNSFTKFFNKFIFFAIPLLLLFSVIYFNFVSLNIENEISLKIITSIALTLFSLSWLYSIKIKSTKNKLIFILLGPYLVFTILVQNGILNDRSKELRIASQAIIEKENLYNQKVEFITTGVNNEISTKKLIKLAIFMPKIGLERNTIENLVQNQYAWTVIPKEEILSKNQFKIVANSKTLKPWILIKKE